MFKRKEYSWEKWGKLLAEYFHELERLFWADLFIVGGGVSDEWERDAAHINLNTPIIPAKMFNLAGIVGAALAAHQGEKHPAPSGKASTHA